MEREYEALPSTANHCEICSFREVQTPEDPIKIADEGAAVALLINEEQLGVDVVAEMHRNLSAKSIMAAKFCAYCIQAGLCRSFKITPPDLATGMKRVIRKAS